MQTRFEKIAELHQQAFLAMKAITFYIEVLNHNAERAKTENGMMRPVCLGMVQYAADNIANHGQEYDRLMAEINALHPKYIGVDALIDEVVKKP